jgi:hypothetical protein
VPVVDERQMNDRLNGCERLEENARDHAESSFSDLSPYVSGRREGRPETSSAN